MGPPSDTVPTTNYVGPLATSFSLPPSLLPGPRDFGGFSMMTSSMAPVLSDWLVLPPPSDSPAALAGLGFPGPSRQPSARSRLWEVTAGAFSLRGSRRGRVLGGLWGGIHGWDRGGFITGAGG